MNAYPHAHRVAVRRTWSDGGCYIVEYGDTTVRVHRWLFGRTPSAKRLRRAALRAIRKHDRGSRRAGKVTNVIKAATDELNATLTRPDESFADIYPQGYGFQRMIGRDDEWGSVLVDSELPEPYVPGGVLRSAG